MTDFTYFPATTEDRSTDVLEAAVYGRFAQASHAFSEYVDNNNVLIEGGTESYSSDDALLAVLTADGMKNGIEIIADMWDADAVYDQVQALNALGLDCWVDSEYTTEVNGALFRYATNNIANASRATADSDQSRKTPGHVKINCA